MALSAARYSATIQSLYLYAARLRTTTMMRTAISTTPRREPFSDRERSMVLRLGRAALGGGVVLALDAVCGGDGHHVAIRLQLRIAGLAGRQDPERDADCPR